MRYVYLSVPHRLRFPGALAIVVAVATACGSSPNPNRPADDTAQSDDDPATDDAPPPPDLPVTTAVVDATVQPTSAGAPGRPLAAITGDANAKVDIVAGELVIATEDDAAVQSFLARHGGSIVSTIRFSDLGLADVPTLYHVRVTELSDSDPTQLGAELTQRSPERPDHLRASDEATLRLLALAVTSSKPGFVVNVNSIIVPQGVVEGTSYEAATPNYSGLRNDYGRNYDPNAFNWPYMTSGYDQDIGVGDAWRYLAAADKLKPTVRLLVVDGGFRQHDDLPANTTMLSTWNVPNAASCGGKPCDWHGTAVASAAASIINNGVGTAGSGGPVVKLYLGQIWGEVNDVGDVFKRLYETLSSLVSISGVIAGGEPLIINISAGTQLPAILDAVVSPVWDVLTGGLRLKGVMILAAAGNEATDVDREECFTVFCWEPTVTIPCELNNVMCIGGTKSASLTRHPGSNWGSQGSIDLFAPYIVWTVDADAIDNGRAMKAKLTAGTSVSTPFTAGIAALVWAANINRGVNAVETILMNTATPSPDSQVRRVVNAGAAVRAALGAGAPRIFEWPQETLLRTLNQPLVVTLNNPGFLFGYDANIRAYASAPGPMTLTAASDDVRDTPSGNTVRFGGTGVRTITVTVTDSDGGSDSRSFSTDVRLADGRLFAALGSGSTWADQPLYADARGYERNGPINDPASVFVDAPCGRVRWQLPLVHTPLGNRPVGTVITEMDDGAVGQLTGTAIGCHAKIALGEGNHNINVSLLGGDNTTVLVLRQLPVHVDPRVDGEAPVVGSVAVFDSADNTVLDPSELAFYPTGVFKTARFMRVQYTDPGDQSIEGLRFTVESLVTGGRGDITIDVANQDHAEDGLLPSADSTITPWDTLWLGSEPEPSLVVLRASVTDNGLTATRPYLVRLRRASILD